MRACTYKATLRIDYENCAKNYELIYKGPDSEREAREEADALLHAHKAIKRVTLTVTKECHI